MKSERTSFWLICYGLFLIAAGVAGWLSNPERAQTALISGGTFGGLALVLGVVARSGKRWPVWLAAGVTTLLLIVFAVRATITWGKWISGDASKLFAAILITAMFFASLSMIVHLVRRLRGAPMPRSG